MTFQKRFPVWLLALALVVSWAIPAQAAPVDVAGDFFKWLTGKGLRSLALLWVAPTAGQLHKEGMMMDPDGFEHSAQSAPGIDPDPVLPPSGPGI